MFKLKSGTKINSNMLNSMTWFIFYVLYWSFGFLINFVQKIKIKAKLWCFTNSTYFGGNLLQNIKIIFLGENIVLKTNMNMYEYGADDCFFQF